VTAGSARGPDAGRDPGLDAARALATIGVIFAHGLASYLTTAIGWAVRDTSRSQVADLLIWTARQFLMPTFFLLSGWLGARSLARMGAAALVRHRARRLALPLVIFLVPMSLAMNGLWDWGRALAGRDPVSAPVPALSPSSLPVTLGHLWYLYYLIMLTLLALAAAAAWRRAPATWQAAHQRAVSAIDRSGLAAVVCAVPTAVCLAVGDQLQLDTPLDFVPDVLNLCYFGGFFAWGWWLGGGWLARDPAVPGRARAPVSVAVASGLIALLVPPLIASVDGARPPAWALGAAALSSWLLVTAVVDACRRWRRPPAALRPIAVASFWTYLVHVPLLILLQLGASRLHLPGPLEYVAICLLALGGSLASFALIRRTPVGRLVA
jgi:glucans biosynthesis protein C